MDMPSVVVLIVCKTVMVGEPDLNSSFTGYEPREWAYDHSMMVCRRQEVQLWDQAEAMGATPRPFTQMECWKSGMLLGSQWDVGHRGSAYRFWKVACPVPIKNYGQDGIQGTNDDEIVGWKLPDCGSRDTVICETDTAI